MNSNPNSTSPNVIEKPNLSKQAKLTRWQHRWQKLPVAIREYLTSYTWSLGFNLALLVVLSLVFFPTPYKEPIELTLSIGTEPIPDSIDIAPLVELVPDEPDESELETDLENLEAMDPKLELEEQLDFPELPVVTDTSMAKTVDEIMPANLSELTTNEQRINEINRRVAAAGGELEGLVRVSLAFTGDDDIDLHVHLQGRHLQRNYRTEVNNYLWYRAPQSTWGFLDVDANAQIVVPFPAENIVFHRPPKNGKYQVTIHHYASRGTREPTPYVVLVKRRNAEKIYKGTIEPFQQIRICEFTFSHRENWEFIQR